MSESPELSQAFLNRPDDAILVIDAADRTIVEANAQAIQFTGYPTGELQGIRVDRLLRTHDGAQYLLLDDGTNKGVATEWQNIRLFTKDGATVAVEIRSCWFTGRLAGYILLAVRKAESDLSRVTPASSTAWEREDFPTIIGQSGRIRDVCRLIGSLAKTDATVLILGETGTGKEIIANAVHAHSRRHGGPLVKVNCAALTETLLESELFGHVKGAFTGAVHDRRGRFKQADGGTIFLDEVGSMPLAGQAKLLRVLQEREFEPVGSSVTTRVNVRVIAATNTDLTKAVAERRFREDLYYRLNVFLISLPSLRERKEDVGLLAQHFLNTYSKALARDIRTFAPETLSWLVQHDWPGNVRELANAIEHAVIVESGPVILPASLPANLLKPRDMDSCGPLSAEVGLREKLNSLERQILIETLVRANWIKKRAAAMLGVDPRNLPYLLRKHRLDEDTVVPAHRNNSDVDHNSYERYPTPTSAANLVRYS